MQHCQLEARRRFFCCRVIQRWNSLSHDIVDAPSLPVFKSRLQSFLGNDLFSFWSHFPQFHPPTLPYSVSSLFLPFDIFLSFFYWKMHSTSHSLSSCSNTCSLTGVFVLVFWACPPLSSLAGNRVIRPYQVSWPGELTIAFLIQLAFSALCPLFPRLAGDAKRFFPFSRK